MPRPMLKFRNYNPQTDKLQEKKLPRVKPEPSRWNQYCLTKCNVLSFCSVLVQVQEQLESGKEANTVKDVVSCSVIII